MRPELDEDRHVGVEQTAQRVREQHRLAKVAAPIGGVELVADKASKRPFAPQHAVGARTVRFAEQEGLIVRSVAGDVLTISPPLIIGGAQIEDLFNRLTRALDKALDWVTRERLTQA